MREFVTPLNRIRAIVERLRDPVNGCDWDRVQTFATIAPYTIEEAYEVADAIARDDMAALKDELGDLLFQVLLHSRIAEQAGWFSLDDVATALADKMERRHPHLFGPEDDRPSERPDWEGLKATERAADASALDGVALALPALTRAFGIGPVKPGSRRALLKLFGPHQRRQRQRDAIKCAGVGGALGGFQAFPIRTL
jgi:nucleoside triphosphate diphosphatase